MRIIPPLGLFEAHPVRLQIQEILRRVHTGDVITYADLSAETELDIHEYRHLLSYARDVLVDEGIVFDVVPTVGLKRVDSAGALAVVEGDTRRLKNTAQRAGRKMRAVDLEQLTPSERIRFGLSQVRIGIVQQFARKSTANKVEKALQADIAPAQLSKSVVGSLKQFE